MKTLNVADPPDTMKTYSNELKNGKFVDNYKDIGPGVNILLQRAKIIMQPKDTIMVFPEGVMLNYLLRKSNPTPYINFAPPELLMFGEDNMIAAMNNNKPDIVIIVHQNWGDVYKIQHYGKDIKYGRRIMEWIHKNYKTVEINLNEPLKDDNFGIKIMRRNDEKPLLSTTGIK